MLSPRPLQLWTSINTTASSLFFLHPLTGKNGGCVIVDVFMLNVREHAERVIAVYGMFEKVVCRLKTEESLCRSVLAGA